MEQEHNHNSIAGIWTALLEKYLLPKELAFSYSDLIAFYFYFFFFFFEIIKYQKCWSILYISCTGTNHIACQNTLLLQGKYITPHLIVKHLLLSISVPKQWPWLIAHSRTSVPSVWVHDVLSSGYSSYRERQICDIRRETVKHPLNAVMSSFHLPQAPTSWLDSIYIFKQ